MAISLSFVKYSIVSFGKSGTYALTIRGAERIDQRAKCARCSVRERLGSSTTRKSGSFFYRDVGQQELDIENTFGESGHIHSSLGLVLEPQLLRSLLFEAFPHVSPFFQSAKAHVPSP